MKCTPNTVFFAFRRYFGLVVIEFSTLTTNFLQTTTSNFPHGSNKTNDMVQVGSGRFISRNRHQKLFLQAICQFSGVEHASSRHSVQVECWLLDINPAMDHADRMNITFPGHEGVSDEINAKYLFLRQMSDFGQFWRAKHVFSRHPLQIECWFLHRNPPMG